MYSRSLDSWFGLTIRDWTTPGTMPRRTTRATTQTTITAGHHWRRRQTFQTSTAAMAKASTIVTRVSGRRTTTSV